MDKKQLFQRFQKPILSIANNPFGRKYLGIDKEVKEKIIWITPDSYIIAGKKRNEVKQVFRCYDLFAKKLEYGIKLGASLGLGAFIPKLAPVLLLTTFYAYTGSGDGYVGNSAGQGNWASVRSASSGSVVDYTSATGYCMITQNTGAGTLIYRSFYPFDTSSVCAGSTITLVVFEVYGSSNYSDTTDSVNVVAGTQASVTELVLDDFDQVGSTVFSDAISLHLSNTEYNAFLLNSNGLANISKTATSKFACRGTKDINNTDPSGQANGHSVYFSEQAGTSKDPLLAVEYTLPAGASFFL